MNAEDDEVLVCELCGDEYTMTEFRAWCWQDYSPLCWRCDSARMMALMERKYGIKFSQDDHTTTEVEP